MKKGFTIIEFVVTIALVAIVAGFAIINLNPVGQIAAARNSERIAHLNAIGNAVRMNIADTRTGKISCLAGDIPVSSTKMSIGVGNYDIAPCLVPTYIFAMPFDPSADGAHYVSNSDYDSGYFISKNASSGQITISAPSAELGKTIFIIR